MDTNFYAPPAAAVADPVVTGGLATRADPFFVVAPWKFALLFGATIGLYQYYWLYMHWARFRRCTGEPMWPVARAILSVFFAHSLNREIDHRIGRVELHAWAPGALATLYVVCTIGGALADRLSAREIGSPYTDLAGLVLLLPIGYSLARTQAAANIACGDPQAVGNRRLSWANWIWLVLGAVLWILMLLGLGIMVTEEG